MQEKIKKVTSVTKEGYVLDIARDTFIGFKCQMCSTAHIADEDTLRNRDLLIDYVLMCKNEHEGCRYM